MAERFVPDPVLNMRSPKQMVVLLYSALCLQVRLRNKLTDKQREAGKTQGNPSTDEDAIVHAIIYDCKDTPEIKEFLETVIDAKECLTEESLYFRAWKVNQHWRDGYIHFHPGHAAAKSGRQTPSRPNAAQLAKESQVRQMVTADDDHVIVSLDESGQELRITAWQSRCPDMLSCYVGDTPRDIHSMTGLGIFNMNVEGEEGRPQLTYEEFVVSVKDTNHPWHTQAKKCRREAKPVNFLDLFLGTKMTLAVDLRISEDVAQKMLDAKTEMFPGVRAWQERTKENLLNVGYAVEPMGRRRHLKLDGTWRDNHEVRGGVNHLIQGSAASQLKLIMRKVWENRILERYRAYFLMGIHDEVVFSVHKLDVVAFLKEVHPLMSQQYADFEVPFKSSIAIGPNFYDLLELGEVLDEEAVNKAVEAVNLRNTLPKTNCGECKMKCIELAYEVVCGRSELSACQCTN